MDERELEARLSARLHRRFDRGQPSIALEHSVRTMFARPQRQGWLGDRRFAWALSAAVAAIVVVAVAVSLLRPAQSVGPASSPTPTVAGLGQSTASSGSSTTEIRPFIVLPTLPAQAAPEADAAAIAFRVRLITLGIPDSDAQPTIGPQTGFGDGISFELQSGGPSDAEVRDVLAAPGVVSISGVPAQSALTVIAPVLGQPLKCCSDEIVTPTDIASYEVPFDHSSVTLHLTDRGAAKLQGWTSSHVGGLLVVALDGLVVSAPIVQAPIVDGLLELIPGPDDQASLERFMAVVRGGPLPPTWSHPIVPVLISPDQADAIALEASGSLIPPAIEQPPGPRLLDLETVRTSAPVPTDIVAYFVDVDGDFGPQASCRGIAAGETCPPLRFKVVEVNAVTGEVLGIVGPGETFGPPPS